MNLGAIALSKAGSLAEIAAKLAVDKSTVCRWRKSQRLPETLQRTAMLSAFGIDPLLWDREEPKASPLMAPGVPVAVAEEERDDEDVDGEEDAADGDEDGKTARARLRDHLDQLEDKLGGDINARDWATLAQAKTRAIEVLAKLNGETSPSDEEKLARSATWLKMQVAIADALKPYPDAAKAVAAVIGGARS